MASPSSQPTQVLEVGAGEIRSLDLSPLAPLAGLPAAELAGRAGTVDLRFVWPRPDDDPRELSEIPEVRLWCLRADALHPWLPYLLERSGGGLTRHAAMLLPHGFDRQEGIRFAPESLDLWITHRLLLLDERAREAGIDCRQGLAQMAAVLGFELDPAFWSLLPAGPGPALSGPAAR